MSNGNLTDNSLPKNILKFIPQPNPHSLKIGNSPRNNTGDFTSEESIIRSMRKFEKYARTRFFRNFWQDSKLKYRVTQDCFLKQLARYPQYELEILKANIESNLELSKYFMGFALLIAWISDRGFSHNLKITSLSAVLMVTFGLAIYQILMTQLTRVKWLKIAIAKKSKI